MQLHDPKPLTVEFQSRDITFDSDLTPTVYEVEYEFKSGRKWINYRTVYASYQRAKDSLENIKYLASIAKPCHRNVRFNQITIH